MDIASKTKKTQYMVYVIIFSVAILLVLITTMFWCNFDLAGTTQMGNYWQMLSAMAVIMGVGAIIMQYIDSNHQREYEQQQTFISQTESHWIELEKYFAQNYPYLARLYQQIYSGNKTLRGLPKGLNKDEMEKVVAFEQHTASILFQIIENIYVFLSSPLGSSEYCGWLNVWKSWFKSPIVLQQWHQTRSFYNQQTQNFIDYCIIKECPELKRFCDTEQKTNNLIGYKPLGSWQ